MSDEIKSELKQTICQMMHKMLMQAGVSALEDCIRICICYEKMGQPLLATKFIEPVVAFSATTEEKPKATKGKKNEAV